MQLMKSIEDEEVSLLVANPFYFYPEYEWVLSDTVKQELQIESEQDVEVWTIITVPVAPSKATINLLAPLVLNPNNQAGKQVILHDSEYTTRSPLIRA